MYFLQNPQHGNWHIHIPLISDISRTKYQNLNDSRLVLHLPLPNLLKPCFSREWRCSWSSADRRCSNYIWVINNFIAYKGASYIRDLTVLLQAVVGISRSELGCDWPLAEIFGATTGSLLVALVLLFVSFKYWGELKMLLYITFGWRPLDKKDNHIIGKVSINLFWYAVLLTSCQWPNGLTWSIRE